METANVRELARGGGPAIETAYGLTPARVTEILASTAALEAEVLRLATMLPFEAEPWGFGDGLLRLAIRE